MAHIFFEKLENRRSTDSLVPVRRAMYGVEVFEHPSDSYPRSFYPADNVPDTNSASWVNLSLPWGQSQMWLPTQWNTQQWNMPTWNQSTWNLPTWNQSTWNLPTWNQSTWNLPTWNMPMWNQPTWNLPTWNLPTWNLPMWNQPLIPSEWNPTPWDISPSYAYGVGIPTGISSATGILF